MVKYAKEEPFFPGDIKSKALYRKKPLLYVGKTHAYLNRVSKRIAISYATLCHTHSSILDNEYIWLASFSVIDQTHLRFPSKMRS